MGLTSGLQFGPVPLPQNITASETFPIANGMARLAADWMSAATLFLWQGLPRPVTGLKIFVGWTGGFVLLTTLMVPYLRKFGKATVPDFVGDRFIQMEPDLLLC